MPVYTVRGVVDDPASHAISAVLEELKKRGATIEIVKELYLELDWEAELRKLQLAHGGQYYGHQAGTPLVTRDGAYIGGFQPFVTHVGSTFGFKDTVALEYFQFAAVDALRQRLKQSKNVLCYMDIKTGNKPLRRAIFELYNDICPLASENFRALCTGEKGRTLCYKGSPFHRAVPDGWVQGGDIVTGAGDNSITAFGSETFPDECFAVPMDKPGVLALANRGPHSNGSQFMVTVAGGLDWLQCKTVGFGRVIKGMEVFRDIALMPTLNDRPTADCIIVNCGQVNLDDEFNTLAR